MAKPRDSTVKSVRRALQLLSLFTPRRPEWSVSDLARATGLHKSVVARLMATMAASGFVVQDAETKLYRIGPAAFAVGSVFQPYQMLDRIARPVLEALAQRSGHSATLGVPDGDRFMIVQSVSGNLSIRVAFEVGERPYYHGASIGKALLAEMPEERVRQIVGPNPLPKITPYTIGTVEKLLVELARVREKGVAFTWEESIIGVGGVAAAVRNAYGECVAAVGIAYPTHLVTEQEIETLAQMVRAAADEISRKIGVLSLGDNPGSAPELKRSDL